MPTQKDMEFAKILIAKDLISKAEMQRLLDELDDTRKRGKKISLEDYIVKEKVLSAPELKILKASKKRMVHCQKCKMMYRVTESDVGKRFKCKKCGVMLIVPMPGQTQTKSVKDLVDKKPKQPQIDTQKVIKTVTREIPMMDDNILLVNQDHEVVGKETPAINVSSGGKAEPPEITIDLGLDDEFDDDSDFEVTAVDYEVHATQVGASKGSASPEITIDLGLDDELDEEDEEDSDYHIASIPEPELSPSGFTISPGDQSGPPEITIDLGLDDETEEDSDYHIASIPEPELSPSGFTISPDDDQSGPPEITIDLGLDDETEEDSPPQVQAVPESIAPGNKPMHEATITIGPDDSYEDEDSPYEISAVNFDEVPAPSTNLTPSTNSTPSTNPVPSEVTIDLGLDEDEDEEDSPPQIQAVNPPAVKPVPKAVVPTSPIASKKTVAPAEITIDIGLDEDDDDDDSPYEISAVNFDEVPVNPAALEKTPAVTPVSPAKSSTPPKPMTEVTLDLGLDDDDDDDDAELIDDGDYNIEYPLGQGPVGYIYRARRKKDNSQVAIRVLHPHLVNNELLEQLKEEVVGSSKLSHPNILSIYEVGQAKDSTCYAMQYVEGGEELKKAQSKISRSEKAIVQMAILLADALSVLHKSGLVYEYLNPNNILVSGQTPYIRDVGLFSVHDTANAIAQEKKNLNPAYMSPEQVSEILKPDTGEIDHRTDIYSLGVVMYWLATNTTPFSHDEANKTMHKIMNDKPIPPMEQNAQVSKQFNYIILKAMARDSQSRYQTSQALAVDLSSLK